MANRDATRRRARRGFQRKGRRYEHVQLEELLRRCSGITVWDGRTIILQRCDHPGDPRPPGVAQSRQAELLPSEQYLIDALERDFNAPGTGNYVSRDQCVARLLGVLDALGGGAQIILR